MKYFTPFVILLSLLVLFSCSIEDLFIQPEVEVTGYTLLELPTDTAYLEIDMLVTNMDKRQVHVADVDYEVVLEGITLPTQQTIVDMDIYPDSTIAMTVPLSMATNDAVKILAKLDAGEELAYTVTGLFHVDDPIYNLFDIPLNVTGTAAVDAGFEDFYEMPTVTVLGINGNFTDSGNDSYVFDFITTCAIHNNDPRAVSIDEVEYKVTIEGILSENHLLSDTYPEGISIEGNGDDTLTLPIILTVDATAGAALATAMQEDNIDYIVEGLFNATGVDSIETDFTLPMYLTGNINADFLSTLFVQPTVEITGFSLLSLPADTTFMEIDMVLTNNDSRTATIADVDYQCMIEGIESIVEYVDVNQTIGSTPLELSMPLTLLTKDAIVLLEKLDDGEELSYEVDGTFHIDDPVLNQFDLPLDIAGSAYVEVGYEDFYEKPTLTMLDMAGDFTQNEQGNYVFDFDVACRVQNNDPNSVTVSDVEYVVNIEGIPSEALKYSDTYSQPLSINGNSSVDMTLPVILTLDESAGETLALAIKDGAIDYEVEGLVSVSHLNGSPLEFQLPMILNGSTEADIFAQMFAQPTIEVTGYTLLDIPGDTAFMMIDMLLTNNDTRTAHIYDVEYQTIVGGITALPEHVIVDETIPTDTITLTMPLTLLTNDAIQLLDKLEAGESIAYEVTGTFHIDDPILDDFDLPIDISGTATVDVGYEDFYEQPEVTVTNIAGTYKINGFTSYTLNFDVNCSVQNIDTRSAEIDEIEYTVTIEGTKSSKHYYSNTYSSNFTIAGSATESLVLPVTFNLGISGGAAMVAACADGTINYVVEGTFHVILADGTTVDFTLPLYITGSVPATMIAN